MNESVSGYLASIQREFETGNATEHSYRHSLKALIEGINNKVIATNEPKRRACGAPDYIITRGEIPVGFIEAKDVGKNLQEVEKSNQMDRYLESLENLILTDYLEFRFYIQGEYIDSVRIAHIDRGKLVFESDNAEKLVNLLSNFTAYHGQTIRSASKLAKAMAGKARLMKDVIVEALKDEEDGGGELRSELEAFRNILIHDMKEQEFADMYAQTIAYGLFAARLHDPTLETFSRQEASELLPKTNPFLRKLFHTIAGPDLDTRIVWIVDSLADVFRSADIKKILESFSSESKKLDPFIHFYETFLSEYDPKLRKSRGVWYTPESAVKFIVRAVDDILKQDFALPKGLADTSTTTVKIDAQMHDGRFKDGVRKIEKEVHRVQILDPATGTGTFLAEVVRKIYANFEGQAGIWESYVNQHLLPRIHGFELLMASYAMCHLKLDLLLRELGYQHKQHSAERLSVYLTNSLEEAHPDTNTLFSSWLSNEANEANKVKKETPVMVVVGNPPYSGESSNKGKFIMELMDEYKKEPGGEEKLKERNPKWINDDYVKFIRFSEHMIEKNGEGVLGFITNHGYLDNPTFRGMRWHLLKTFDKIYILDLHGNSKRKEVTPDGGKDENVFDIQQGVSIILAVKNGENTNTLAKVYHKDIYGKRQEKYDYLTSSDILSIKWNLLPNQGPNYPFVERDFEAMEKYKEGFSLNDLFDVKSLGIVTARDAFTIGFTRDGVYDKMQDFINLESDEARSKYSLGKDVRDWTVMGAQNDLKQNGCNIIPLAYRPFDVRFTPYTGNSRGVHCYPRTEVMSNLLQVDNIALLVPKAHRDKAFAHVFVAQNPSEAIFLSGTTGSNAMCLPLYIYPHANVQDTVNGSGDRKPNLDSKIINHIAEKIGLRFVSDERHPDANAYTTFSPLDLWNYIYAVLHSPAYRLKYDEFLKLDYPYIPYPKNADQFNALAELGAELRQWHLMKHADSDKLITEFPVSGSNEIKKGYPKFKDGKVYINEEQYFDNVSEVAWEFYIGGYQPAQKWLKYRREHKLSFEDILHWQKIITALENTDRIMKEIDQIDL